MVSESRTPRGMSRLASLASSPSDVIDSKPTSRKIAMVACSITQLKLCGAMTDHALGCAEGVAAECVVKDLAATIESQPG